MCFRDRGRKELGYSSEKVVDSSEFISYLGSPLNNSGSAF